MFLAPATFADANDFDHFGTSLKASQLLAPEFQPLRLVLYTATAFFGSVGLQQ